MGHCDLILDSHTQSGRFKDMWFSPGMRILPGVLNTRGGLWGAALVKLQKMLFPSSPWAVVQVHSLEDNVVRPPHVLSLNQEYLS